MPHDFDFDAFMNEFSSKKVKGNDGEQEPSKPNEHLAERCVLKIGSSAGFQNLDVEVDKSVKQMKKLPALLYTPAKARCGSLSG